MFSGGEPQLNEKWAWLARMMRSIGSRVTLLTAGLLLESQARTVAESVDDVIVSLDGPPALHNNIRRIPNAFEQWRPGFARYVNCVPTWKCARAARFRKQTITPLAQSPRTRSRSACFPYLFSPPI